MLLLRWIITVSLCLPALASAGQAFEPPHPRMNKMLTRQFLDMHMQYPQDAFNKGVQGTVKISFLTDRLGNVTSRLIKQSVSPGLDSAALALFDMILWEPATSYGKPVNGEGEFRIKYNISKYESLLKKRGYDKLPRPVDPVDHSGKVFSLKDLDQPPEPLLDTVFKSLPEWITANLNFPEAAARLNIEGDVELRFVIETSGLPSNISVLHPVGGGCTEEAIRIVNQSKWKPGIHSGEGVRTCYYLTIKFDAAGELKNKYIPNQTSSGI